MDSEDEARQQEQIAALYAQDTEDEEEEEEGGGGGGEAEDMEVEVPTTSGAATAVAGGAASLQQQQQQLEEDQLQGGDTTGVVGADKPAAMDASPSLEQGQHQQQEQEDFDRGPSLGAGGNEYGGMEVLQQGKQNQQDYTALLEAATQPLPEDVLLQHRQQQGQAAEGVGPSGTGRGVGANVGGSQAQRPAATAPVGDAAGVVGSLVVDVAGGGSGGSGGLVGGTSGREQDDPLGLAGLAQGGRVESSNPPTFKVRKKRR